MQATFVFEKIVERGEQMLKFTGYKNVLEHSDLPEEYTKDVYSSPCSIPAFWAYRNSDVCIYFAGMSDLTIGNVYTPETIRTHIVLAKKAGARLAEIKKDLEKKNKNWKGTTTIVI